MLSLFKVVGRAEREGSVFWNVFRTTQNWPPTEIATSEATTEVLLACAWSSPLTVQEPTILLNWRIDIQAINL